MSESSFEEIEDREKLRRFADDNLLAEEQSRLGLSKPLNLDGLLLRVETRIRMESEPLTPESRPLSPRPR